MGGRLVIPVGPVGKQQSLYVYDKTEEGITEQLIEPVLFVPMVAGVVVA
jgi:protein-L-isoaspartate(D-aspartate) O-methyltransferase